MTTASTGATTPRRWDATRRLGVLAPIVGPALIVVSVPVALFRAAVEGRVWNHDPLLLWMPMWTYLGRSLRAGHIPAWQTGMLAGAPFASDPQSGWAYLEPMILFAVLSPQAAIRAMVVLQPIVAGLGLFAFLRSETVPRWAACSGGVALALGMTGATIGQTLPFSAGLAWTAVTLAAASRMMRASTPARVVLWMLAAAIAWGQLLAAHAGLGVMMGTLPVIAYLVGAAAAGYRSGKRPWRRGIGAPIGLAIAAPAVNLAFLLPRIAYLPETNMGLGYLGLARLGERLSGSSGGIRIPGRGTPVDWLVGLATVPGAYVGGAILLGSLLCLARARRQLGGAMLAGGIVAYVFSLTVVSGHTPLWFDRFRPVDLYLHAPNWLGYEILLFITVLGAIGLASWPSATKRTRIAAVLAAAMLWLLTPVLLGVPLRGLMLVLPGVLLACIALEIGRRHPAALWAVPCLLAFELGVNTVRLANDQPVKPVLGHLPARLGEGLPNYQMVNPRPALRPSRRDQLFTASNGVRYVVQGGVPPTARNRATDSALFPDWGLISGAGNAGGYNAVELLRYWKFVRAASDHPISTYEQVKFQGVSALAQNLLRIGWIVNPSPDQKASVIQLPTPPQATLIGNWTVAPSADAALAAVTRHGFDPEQTAIVEGKTMPASSTPRPAGTAAYHAIRPGSATVTVDAIRPSVLLVRTPYADGWTATIDGHPTQVRPVDYVDQGVMVAPGHHIVRLTYTDPWLWRGVIASTVAVAVMLALAGILSRRGSPSPQ